MEKAMNLYDVISDVKHQNGVITIYSILFCFDLTGFYELNVFRVTCFRCLNLPKML